MIRKTTDNTKFDNQIFNEDCRQTIQKMIQHHTTNAQAAQGIHKMVTLCSCGLLARFCYHCLHGAHPRFGLISSCNLINVSVAIMCAYFTSTNSMWKFNSLPAISWLASKVILVSSLAVTKTGTGRP